MRIGSRAIVLRMATLFVFLAAVACGAVRLSPGAAFPPQKAG
jgi:hypothetical protein